MGESAKRMKNILSEVGTFNGHESRFESWYDLTLIAFETYYPEVKDIIEGHQKPVEVYSLASEHDQRGLAAGSTTNTSSDSAEVPDIQQPEEPARKETVSEQFKRIEIEAAAAAAKKAADEAAKTPSEEGKETSDDGGPPPSPVESDIQSVLSDHQPPAMILTNQSARDQWDRANSMLYNVLRLRTTGVAASLVKKYKPRPGCKADGVTVWRAIKETYEPCDFVQKQALVERLNHSSMREGAHPETFIADMQDIVNKLAIMGVAIPDEHLANVILRGLPASYDALRLQADMNAGFDLKKIVTTAKNIHRSRTRDQHGGHRPVEKQLGRDAGMVAVSRPQSSIICHSCGEKGHIIRNCPHHSPRGRGSSNDFRSFRSGGTNQPHQNHKSGGHFSRNRTAARKEAKWCQLHNTPNHSNAECHAQAAGRQASAASFSRSRGPSEDATSQTDGEPSSGDHRAISATTTSTPQEATEPYSGSTGGFTWMATHTTASESKDEFSMLVDSGASAHFIDSNLLPDLHEFLFNRRELQPRMVIQTAGLRSIYGVATGQLPCIAVDTDGIEREITVRVTLVPGLGRHLFSPKAAQQHGIYTMFAASNYIDCRQFKVGLRHSELLDHVDLRLNRGGIKRHAVESKPFVRDVGPDQLAIVATSSINNVWQNRLGHLHQAVVRVATRIPEAGTIVNDITSTVTGVTRCLLQGVNLPTWSWLQIPFCTVFGKLGTAFSQVRMVGEISVHQGRHGSKLDDEARSFFANATEVNHHDSALLRDADSRGNMDIDFDSGNNTERDISGANGGVNTDADTDATSIASGGPGTQKKLTPKQWRALRQKACTTAESSHATSPHVSSATAPSPNTFRQAMPFGWKYKAANKQPRRYNNNNNNNNNINNNNDDDDDNSSSNNSRRNNDNGKSNNNRRNVHITSRHRHRLQGSRFNISRPSSFRKMQVK